MASEEFLLEVQGGLEYTEEAAPEPIPLTAACTV